MLDTSLLQFLLILQVSCAHCLSLNSHRTFNHLHQIHKTSSVSCDSHLSGCLISGYQEPCRPHLRFPPSTSCFAHSGCSTKPRKSSPYGPLDPLVRWNYVFPLSLLLKRISILCVEINKDHSMRTSKDHLFTARYSKGFSHHHLHFGRDSKAGTEVGKLYSGKKERGWCPDCRLWVWESCQRAHENRDIPCVWLR